MIYLHPIHLTHPTHPSSDRIYFAVFFGFLIPYSCKQSVFPLQSKHTLKEDTMNRKHFFILFLIVAVTFIPKMTVASDPLVSQLEANVKAGEIFHIIEELSSEKYQGRLTGTEGYTKAAQWAAAFFRKHNVRPLFKSDSLELSYFQEWPLNYTKVFKSTLKIVYKDKSGMKKSITGRYFDNFYPLGFSGSGVADAEIVFAGYGISAPEFGYDDYKNLDVNGKIVMVTGGVPTRKRNEDWTPYSYHRHRTRNAYEHGAAGLIYIRAPLASPNGDYIESFPMVSLKPETADFIFASKDLDMEKIKSMLRERTFQPFTTGAVGHIMVESKNINGKGINVAGFIAGSDPELRNEYIILGGHLDHCGSWPELTPGAEDNGSGSAAILMAAKALAAMHPKPKRSILFVLFGGEEMGLKGALHFAQNLPEHVRPEKVKFMINMDMVSAGPNTFIMNMKSYPDFEKLVHEAKEVFQLKLEVKGNKVNPPFRPNSDYYAFAKEGIPAVSWFSSEGDHHGYHSPADTIYWITPKIAESIVRMACYCAYKMADEPRQ